jgi:hypothetical protein
MGAGGRRKFQIPKAKFEVRAKGQGGKFQATNGRAVLEIFCLSLLWHLPGIWLLEFPPAPAVKLLRHHRMRLSLLLILGTLAGGSAALAGGTDLTPRKQFRQSSTYPFIFRPECYLATTGPVPMRFAAPGPDCHARKAPKLTLAAKGAPKEEPAAPVEKAPEPPPPPPPPAPDLSAPVPFGPAFPAPTDAQPPESSSHDFSKVPDEVLEYFKNTEGRPLRRDYLFDPIFQPALPNDLPKSKATYRVQP